MWQKVKIALSLLAVWFVIHSCVIIGDGLCDETSKSQVGVIMGNKVNEDGSLSIRLQKRLDKGVELYRDSLVKQLFVSGGLGKEGFCEGTKMREYLVSKGVPERAILVDNEGSTTRATAYNFHLTYNEQVSVTVITQYYHITRSKLAFKKRGYTKVRGAHCAYFELRDFYSLSREFPGFYEYLLSDGEK